MKHILIMKEVFFYVESNLHLFFLNVPPSSFRHKPVCGCVDMCAHVCMGGGNRIRADVLLSVISQTTTLSGFTVRILESHTWEEKGKARTVRML